MKGIKDSKFLVFQMDDGAEVKYDLSTGRFIGKKGFPVNSLNTAFKGYRISEIINSIEDENYREFLWYVYEKIPQQNQVTNFGSVLRYASSPQFSNLEQFFAIGMKNKIGSFVSFNSIPSGLIRLLMNHPDVPVTNVLISLYREAPDLVQTALSLFYQTLTDANVYNLLVRGYENSVGFVNMSVYEWVIKRGFSASALFQYFDRIMTYEGLTLIQMENNYWDYVRMASELSPHFDKYPRNLLTVHQIMVRNFNRFNQIHNEEAFQKAVRPELAFTCGKCIIKVPTCTQDIKDEAVQQNNCVASYIKDVINGNCQIVFLRYAKTPDKSLVTMEVRKGKVVQAYRACNTPIRTDDKQIISRYESYLKENKYVY